MAWRRSGDKPFSEPMMVRLLMHICITRLQWVNLLPGLSLDILKMESWTHMDYGTHCKHNYYYILYYIYYTHHASRDALHHGWTCQILYNSLAPWIFEWNLISKQILVINGWGICCVIALWDECYWIVGKSTLLQAIAWWRQATSHYLSQFLLRPRSPYGVTLGFSQCPPVRHSAFLLGFMDNIKNKSIRSKQNRWILYIIG